MLPGVPQPHSNPPDASGAVILNTVHMMQEHASNTDDIKSTIIQNCTFHFPLRVTRSLPKKESINKMIRRQRKFTDWDETTDELRVSLRG